MHLGIGGEDAKRRRVVHQLTRNGVALFYDETGQGDPPILLVHGWCCDHTYFAPQIEHLRKEHRVVAVDLRGHGRSDKPRQEYTMEGFADDLAWQCGQLGVANPVVIGHSMGGAIALEIAARLPGWPAAIVLLDSGVLLPHTLVEGLQPFRRALRTSHYRDAMRQYLTRFFLPTDAPAVKERIVDAMSAAPQHVAASAYEKWLRYDSAAAATACKVPVLAISSAHPIADLVRFRELCPQLVTGQVVGSAHFIQLMVPEQVNPMIDRFLAIGLPRPQPARRPPDG